VLHAAVHFRDYLGRACFVEDIIFLSG
jgi:hypothetical protein